MAVTNVYCGLVAAGAEDGTSWANRVTFDTARASAGISTALNVQGGTYTISADTGAGSLQFGGAAPSSANPFWFIGWNAAMDSVAVGWDDCPVFDCQSGAWDGMNNNPTWDGTGIWGCRIVNPKGDGINIDSSTAIGLVWVDNSASQSIDADDGSVLVFCRVTNSNDRGIFVGGSCHVYFCEAYGSTLTGIESLGIQNQLIGNYARNNTDGISASAFGTALFNTADGNSARGIYAPDTANYYTRFLACNQITNNVDGYETTGSVLLELLNNYNGNTGTDRIIAGAAGIGNLSGTSVDPGYGNITSNEYDVSESTQVDVDMPTNNTLNIGANQAGASGGGGGATGSLHIPQLGRVKTPQ